MKHAYPMYLFGMKKIKHIFLSKTIRRFFNLVLFSMSELLAVKLEGGGSELDQLCPCC